MSTFIRYNAPPILSSFMADPAFGRIVLGPIGSGKTTCCMIELLRRALTQEPGDDGIRHTRFAVVRQTLSQLKMTVLKDVMMWLEEIAVWKVSESTLYIKQRDVSTEWLFLPLDEPADERRLLSTQLTGAWVNEICEVNLDLIPAIGGRCGRFPRGRFGVPTWHGLIGDSNFPTEGSAWHGFLEAPPANFDIFKQPGGRTPSAENLNHLNQTSETIKLPEDHPARLAQGRLYYERNAQAKNKDWVRRYVDAEYGRDPSGAAVFAENFVRRWHCVPTLEPVKLKMLLVGQDFGRNPWSLICQLDYNGRLLVLEEVAAENIGLELHVKRNLRPALSEPRYQNKPIVLIGDPSGTALDSLFEINSFKLLHDMGLSAIPAPTNDLNPRLSAVDKFLTDSRAGGPAMLIDESRCPNLVAALNGGYRFSKNQWGVSQAKPDKNESSHVADDLQYVCLVAQSPGAYEYAMNNTISPLRRRQLRAQHQRMPTQGWT